MNYNKFAYIYDDLMKDAPYEEWVEITEKIIAKYNLNPDEIVDLGCGTGNIAIPLSRNGYHLIGLDLSEEMLAIAYDKMQESNITFPLINQNMKEFQLPNQVDLIISYCDSLNYLAGIEEIKETFRKVYDNLKDNGFFIFDMHTPYKIKEVFKDNTFAWNDKEISVIWLPEVDETNLIVEHDLTFFVQAEDNYYEKFNEIHRQQTYTMDTVKRVLEETGFELLETFADFQMVLVGETSERVFYVCRKRV